MQKSSKSQIEKHFHLFGKILYLFVAVVLVLIGISVIVHSVWNVLSTLQSEEGSVMPVMLDSVGLTVLALAVIDVSKYLIEEEVLRAGELRAIILLSGVVIVLGLGGYQWLSARAESMIAAGNRDKP